MEIPPEPGAGDGEGDGEPRAQRLSSKAIAPGDIVSIDKKGRRFHARVIALEQGESGRFELELRPIERGVSYRRASVREVVDVWRKVRRG